MKTLLAIVAIASTSVSGKIIDYANAYSLSTHECWKNNGVTHTITRAWQSFGRLDPNAGTNLAHCHSAGFSAIDIYMFPCRGKSAST